MNLIHLKYTSLTKVPSNERLEIVHTAMHALKGKPAVEVERYTSDCNYTVNLLQSIFGITNYGIVDGPSNGFEMLEFFN